MGAGSLRTRTTMLGIYRLYWTSAYMRYQHLPELAQAVRDHLKNLMAELGTRYSLGSVAPVSVTSSELRSALAQDIQMLFTELPDHFGSRLMDSATELLRELTAAQRHY